MVLFYGLNADQWFQAGTVGDPVTGLGVSDGGIDLNKRAIYGLSADIAYTEADGTGGTTRFREYGVPDPVSPWDTRTDSEIFDALDRDNKFLGRRSDDLDTSAIDEVDRFGLGVMSYVVRDAGTTTPESEIGAYQTNDGLLLRDKLVVDLYDPDPAITEPKYVLRGGTITVSLFYEEFDTDETLMLNLYEDGLPVNADPIIVAGSEPFPDPLPPPPDTEFPGLVEINLDDYGFGEATYNQVELMAYDDPGIPAEFDDSDFLLEKIEGEEILVREPATGSIQLEKFVKPLIEIPGGGEGKTPGFWKQIDNLKKNGDPKPVAVRRAADWEEALSDTPYTPDSLFSEVFGVIPESGDVTLPEGLDPVSGNAGGQNALVRQAIAAYLNAEHPGIDYQYTVAEIVSWVQDAFATVGDYSDDEAVKGLLETENEKEADLDTPATTTMVMGPLFVANNPGGTPIDPDYSTAILDPNFVLPIGGIATGVVTADEIPAIPIGGTALYYFTVLNNSSEGVEFAPENIDIDDPVLGIPSLIVGAGVLEGETQDGVFNGSPFTFGDADGNGTFSPGEVWIYGGLEEEVTSLGLSTNTASITAMTTLEGEPIMVPPAGFPDITDSASYLGVEPTPI